MIEIWSHPTWDFFHTLADRINEYFLRTHVKEVLYIINIICNNLPCPHCKKHAIKYMKKITIRHIDTKVKLQTILLDFHNDVNRRLLKRMFKFSELKKYNNYKIDIVLSNFVKGFNYKFSSNILGGNLNSNNTRQRVTKQITAWCKKNWKSIQGF